MALEGEGVMRIELQFSCSNLVWKDVLNPVVIVNDKNTGHLLGQTEWISANCNPVFSQTVETEVGSDTQLILSVYGVTDSKVDPRKKIGHAILRVNQIENLEITPTQSVELLLHHKEKQQQALLSQYASTMVVNITSFEASQFQLQSNDHVTLDAKSNNNAFHNDNFEQYPAYSSQQVHQNQHSAQQEYDNEYYQEANDVPKHNSWSHDNQANSGPQAREGLKTESDCSACSAYQKQIQRAMKINSELERDLFVATGGPRSEELRLMLTQKEKHCKKLTDQLDHLTEKMNQIAASAKSEIQALTSQLQVWQQRGYELEERCVEWESCHIAIKQQNDKMRAALDEMGIDAEDVAGTPLSPSRIPNTILANNSDKSPNGHRKNNLNPPNIIRNIVGSPITPAKARGTNEDNRTPAEPEHSNLRGARSPNGTDDLWEWRNFDTNDSSSKSEGDSQKRSLAKPASSQSLAVAPKSPSSYDQRARLLGAKLRKLESQLRQQFKTIRALRDKDKERVQELKEMEEKLKYASEGKTSSTPKHSKYSSRSPPAAYLSSSQSVVDNNSTTELANVAYKLRSLNETLAKALDVPTLAKTSSRAAAAAVREGVPVAFKLAFGCRHLVSIDYDMQVDPFVSVYLKHPQTKELEFVGRTECMTSNRDPKFARRVVLQLPANWRLSQELHVSAHHALDIDLSDSDDLGEEKGEGIPDTSSHSRKRNIRRKENRKNNFNAENDQILGTSSLRIGQLLDAAFSHKSIQLKLHNMADQTIERRLTKHKSKIVVRTFILDTGKDPVLLDEQLSRLSSLCHVAKGRKQVFQSKFPRESHGKNPTVSPAPSSPRETELNVSSGSQQQDRPILNISEAKSSNNQPKGGMSRVSSRAASDDEDGAEEKELDQINLELQLSEQQVTIHRLQEKLILLRTMFARRLFDTQTASPEEVDELKAAAGISIDALESDDPRALLDEVDDKEVESNVVARVLRRNCDLEESNRQLEEEISQIQTDISESNSRRREIQARLNDQFKVKHMMDQKCEALEGIVSQQKALIQDLTVHGRTKTSTSNEQTKKKVKKLMSDLNERKAASDMLETQKRILEGNLKSETRKYRKLFQKYEQLEAKSEGLKSQCDEQILMINNLRESLANSANENGHTSTPTPLVPSEDVKNLELKCNSQKNLIDNFGVIAESIHVTVSNLCQSLVDNLHQMGVDNIPLDHDRLDSCRIPISSMMLSLSCKNLQSLDRLGDNSCNASVSAFWKVPKTGSRYTDICSTETVRSQRNPVFRERIKLKLVELTETAATQLKLDPKLKFSVYDHGTDDEQPPQLIGLAQITASQLLHSVRARKAMHLKLINPKNKQLERRLAQNSSVLVLRGFALKTNECSFQESKEVLEAYDILDRFDTMGIAMFDDGSLMENKGDLYSLLKQQNWTSHVLNSHPELKSLLPLVNAELGRLFQLHGEVVRVMDSEVKRTGSADIVAKEDELTKVTAELSRVQTELQQKHKDCSDLQSQVVELENSLAVTEKQLERIRNQKSSNLEASLSVNNSSLEKQQQLEITNLKEDLHQALEDLQQAEVDIQTLKARIKVERAENETRIQDLEEHFEKELENALVNGNPNFSGAGAAGTPLAPIHENRSLIELERSREEGYRRIEERNIVLTRELKDILELVDTQSNLIEQNAFDGRDHKQKQVRSGTDGQLYGDSALQNWVNSEDINIKLKLQCSGLDPVSFGQHTNLQVHVHGTQASTGQYELEGKTEWLPNSVSSPYENSIDLTCNSSNQDLKIAVYSYSGDIKLDADIRETDSELVGFAYVTLSELLEQDEKGLELRNTWSAEYSKLLTDSEACIIVQHDGISKVVSSPPRNSDNATSELTLADLDMQQKLVMNRLRGLNETLNFKIKHALELQPDSPDVVVFADLYNPDSSNNNTDNEQDKVEVDNDDNLNSLDDVDTNASLDIHSDTPDDDSRWNDANFSL